MKQNRTKTAQSAQRDKGYEKQ